MTDQKTIEEIKRRQEKGETISAEDQKILDEEDSEKTYPSNQEPK